MLCFSDDGRGLNLGGIAAKAEKKGLLPAGHTAPPEAVSELIFQPGFSTQDRASESSGRGIGMDAVRSMMQDLGGDVSLSLAAESQGFRPFVFELHFPRAVGEAKSA